MFNGIFSGDGTYNIGQMGNRISLFVSMYIIILNKLKIYITSKINITKNFQNDRDK